MKAVVKIAGKQYIVAEKDALLVDRLSDDVKEIKVPALAIIDGAKTEVGTPETKVVVTAKVVEAEVKGEKIKVIRYKAKKRVHKVNGHRQQHTVIQITSIK
jgi:large subunit ribosomal protein L21